MRVRPRSALAALVTAVAWAGACGGTSGFPGPRPVALLASSPRAGAAFEAIRQAWIEGETPPATLRWMLESFVGSFPRDELVGFARVLLALVGLDQKDFAMADVQLARTEDLVPGSARDLRTVASARRLRLHGEPETALGLLRPLVGKNVDPLARSVFQEELSLDALATHREYEAISHMDTWLRISVEEDRAANTRRVRALVERLPKDVLVGALQAMRVQRASFGYGIEIERLLSDRLVQIATASADPELARLILDPDAGAIAITGDAGALLGELASSRRGLNVVEGRTVGLLLPTESPGLRDESADVLRGVMWALGLPHGVRAQAAPSVVDAGIRAGHEACGPVEPAPTLDEPRVEEDLRLVTRSDAGSADRTEVSLDELAGEGAAVIVAGLDAPTAARALRWGEQRHVAVVVLVVPEEAASDSPPSFGFVMGESRAEVVRALARAAPALIAGAAPVVDTSEVSSYPPQGGRVAGLLFTPPVSCEIPATRAGAPRFPLAQWEHDHTSSWLVSGSASCAGDLIAELTASRARGAVALTLEAAATTPHGPGLRVVTAHAGVVPLASVNDPRDDELRRFTAALGPVGWWTALGRDASTLARLALRRLPPDEVADPGSVASRRTSARDFLLEARAPLWTTEAAGWTRGRTIPRTVCAIEVPPR